MAEARFDILIIGGGMVGAAAACACAGCGLSIGVVEARAPRRDWPNGEVDLRVSALSRASQRILQRLGAWRRMEDLGVGVYREMHVWDAVGKGAIHFDSADLGEPDLGHIVENRVTQLALWECMERAADVELLCPARVAGLVLFGKSARVTLDDGRIIESDLVVGADGRDSRVRALAGIGTDGWLYDQQAIVAHVSTQEPHRQTAWQRFLPTGPLAFLPLADGRSSIVWSVREDKVGELLALDDDGFSAALTEAFDGRLGRVEVDGPRAAFPLRRQHARQYVGPHLALVGDAAHAVHPLAGQGVNLGLLDVAELAQVVDWAQSKGRGLGALGTLRRYERARWGGNLAMLTAMDGFKRLFSNRILPVAALRSLGLTVADQLMPVKRLFMREALGLDPDLPPLARP